MRKNVRKTIHLVSTSLILAVSLMLTSIPVFADSASAGQWVTGDFHTHTFLSDGSKTATQVADKAVEYGLDWYSATDHGGGKTGTRDQNGVAWPTTTPGYDTVNSAIPRWLSIFSIGESEINNNRTKILQFSGIQCLQREETSGYSATRTFIPMIVKSLTSGLVNIPRITHLLTAKHIREYWMA